MTDKWCPPPAVLTIYRSLVEQATHTGKPAKLLVPGGATVMGYPFTRNTHPLGCRLSVGVGWKIKRPGAKYVSCSIETVQRLLGEKVANGE